jgi:hypothetical protein
MKGQVQGMQRKAAMSAKSEDAAVDSDLGK